MDTRQQISAHESRFTKMRSHPRFEVDIPARFLVKEPNAEFKECRITNLSASGAAIRFRSSEIIKNDSSLLIKISIANTILHISTHADVVWTRHKFNNLVCGVRFMDIISGNLLQRLTTTAPDGSSGRNGSKR